MSLDKFIKALIPRSILGVLLGTIWTVFDIFVYKDYMGIIYGWAILFVAVIFWSWWESREKDDE